MADNAARMVYWPSVTVVSECNNDPTCINEVNNYNYVRLMPGWGVPVVCIVTVVLSVPLYYLFEEPLRRLIQSK